MADFLLLTFLISITTAIWPVGRWGIKGEGSGAVMGFWTSLTAGLTGLAIVLARGIPVASGEVLAAGSLMGVAYAAGFCIIMMRCLKTGPAGPTATVNSVTMVSGVLYNWLWLNPQRPTPLLAMGVAGVCASLVLIGMSKSQGTGQTTRITPAWLRLLMLGGAFAALSYAAQTHNAMRHPHAADLVLFVTAAFLTSGVILLPLVVRAGGFRRRPELVAGIAIGLVNVTAIPIRMSIMPRLGPEVVLPVAIATPIVLVLLIGRIFYGERLNGRGLAGCAIAVIAIAALGYAAGTKPQ